MRVYPSRRRRYSVAGATLAPARQHPVRRDKAAICKAHAGSVEIWIVLMGKLLREIAPLCIIALRPLIECSGPPRTDAYAGTPACAGYRFPKDVIAPGIRSNRDCGILTKHGSEAVRLFGATEERLRLLDASIALVLSCGNPRCTS